MSNLVFEIRINLTIVTIQIYLFVVLRPAFFKIKTN